MLPHNWFCLRNHGSHEYFVTCPTCGIDNHLDGKGNTIIFSEGELIPEGVVRKIRTTSPC